MKESTHSKLHLLEIVDRHDTRTFSVGGHQTLQPLRPVMVFFLMARDLIVHVSSDVRSHELRLQLTQRNVNQTKFGTCATCQTTDTVTVLLCAERLR